MFNDRLPAPTPEQLQQRLTRPNNPNNVANDALEGVMENPVVEISRDIFRLESDIRKLTIRVDKRLITKNIQDSLNHFRKNFELYFESFKTPSNIDAIITAGTNTATYGESVGHILNRFSSLGFENRRLAQQIIQKSRSINNGLATKKDMFILGLRNYKESDLPKFEKEMYVPDVDIDESNSLLRAEGTGFSRSYRQTARQKAPASSSSSSSTSAPSAKAAQPKAPASKSEKSEPRRQQPSAKKQMPTKTEQALNEQLEKNRRQIQHFMAQAKKAEVAYGQRYKQIKELHESAVEEIERSKTEIEQLKSGIAKNEIARSFEQSAEEECSNADFYRYATFGYMGVFFVLVGYLFFETSAIGFDWIKAAVRSLLALTLLIPCSYVARESSNHRQQQHRYMRTALELKVLAPHEGNLPESRLGSLREEVLQGDFSAKSVSKNYSDYYLKRNLDLLEKLNDKLEIKSTDTVEKKASSS